MPLRATRALVSQLRIVYAALKDQPTTLPPSALQQFGRRYVAEMYLTAQQLRDDVAAAGGAAEATRAELQRTLWAACIWELCMHVFVVRPALLTEALVPWWQLHLSDRRLTEHELPALEASARPESAASYWPSVRQLAARGLPELSLRLLKRHTAILSEDGGDEQLLLERLETLIELMPRLLDPQLMQSQPEEVPLGQLEQAALQDFTMRHHVWSADLSALARDADASAPGVASATEIAATARLLSGDAAAIDQATDSWHSKLIAKLLYQQPTTLRWQLRDVLDSCLPPAGAPHISPYLPTSPTSPHISLFHGLRCHLPIPPSSSTFAHPPSPSACLRPRRPRPVQRCPRRRAVG